MVRGELYVDESGVHWMLKSCADSLVLTYQNGVRILKFKAQANTTCAYIGADAVYQYGGGSGPIHYAGFQCAGNETHLVNCSADDQGIRDCQHNEDAGVRCQSGKH